MLITAVLTLIWGILKVLTFPLTVLQDVVVSALVSSGIFNATGYLAVLVALFPGTIRAIISVFVTIIIIEGLVLLYKGIMWGIKRIWK